MSKKEKLPFFSDIIKPERLIIKKNSYHEILEKEYSDSLGENKKLSHKRDRRNNKQIIEEELEIEE